jgi:2-dehydro-3-deoxyphosphogluconate aldolase/(4S)-4-hydroxy-2-oxoglutarate aldolase
MNAILDAILETRLIGIIRMPRYAFPVEVTGALVDGGLTILEFTLSGEGALNAIKAANAAFSGQAHIGAGTVLTPADVTAAAGVGAEFVVTPSINRKVIDACQQIGMPIVCGALTPTEITDALEAGVELIKLFPARSGGPQYVRDLLGPLPKLRLVPTGGVTAENAASFLTAGAVAVAIGGNLVSAEDVSQQHFSEITRRAKACVQAVARTGE